MKPQQVFPAHGLPCEACQQPAHSVEVYPRGRRVIHLDRAVGPCDLPNSPLAPVRKS